MPCTLLPGGAGIVCSSGKRGRKQRCFVRDCRGRALFLCDWPIGKPAPRPEGLVNQPTCSRAGCRHHCRPVGKDKDYCLEHFIAWKQTGGRP